MEDKIRMVVVGFRFGRYIAEQQILSGPGSKYIELTGVCDLDKELTSSFANKHQIKQYCDIDEVLLDPNVEAVGLFTGPNGRAGLISKIIRAGKHVMTTKPFELDSVAALDVLNEAKKLQKVIHLNSPAPLLAADTGQIVQWAHEFNLGQQVSIRFETHGNSFETADGSWYDDPEKCPVAPIFRLGIYGINQIIRLCGSVQQVGVVHSSIRTGRPTPDNAIVSLKFNNGAVGSVHASFCVGNGINYANELTIHYERGTIRFTPAEVAENGDMSVEKVSLQTVDAEGKIITRQARFDKEVIAGAYQWCNFYKAVKSGAILHGEVTPEQIVAGIQVINAMAEAEKTGKNVKIL